MLNVQQLRAAIEKSTATFDKEKAQERLSKLSGGVAVFKVNILSLLKTVIAYLLLPTLQVFIFFQVGGSSEADVGERKDRVTDALNATRAAVEEGIVPGKFLYTVSKVKEHISFFITMTTTRLFLIGGGVALLYATKVLKNLQTANEDQKRGIQIIENALKVSSLKLPVEIL